MPARPMDLSILFGRPWWLALAAAGVLLTGAAGGRWAARHPGPTAGPVPGEAGQANEAQLHRIARKQEVIADLHQGRVGLPEAAAAFRELSRGEPLVLGRLRAVYPRAGEDELPYRQVLHFVYRDPAWATRLPTLTAEFFARFPGADPFPDWLRRPVPRPRPAAGAGRRPVAVQSDD